MGAPKGNNYAVGKGRPTKYKKEYDEQVKKLTYLGAIDADIADFFNVTQKTIDLWKKRYDSFLLSLKSGKAKADDMVVKRLFERATGYEHDDLYITQYQGKIVKESITKHYPPDVTAMIFWLKNRRSDEWRDRHEVDHGVTKDTQDKLNQLFEQADAIINRCQKSLGK